MENSFHSTVMQVVILKSSFLESVWMWTTDKNEFSLLVFAKDNKSEVQKVEFKLIKVWKGTIVSLFQAALLCKQSIICFVSKDGNDRKPN